MFKNKYINYSIFVILCMILWNLISYTYSSLNGTAYPGNDEGIPFVVFAVIGYFLFMKDKDSE